MMYRGQAPTEEWTQQDGSDLVLVPISDDGTIHITREAFAGLMQRAGFVQIAAANDTAEATS